MKDRRGFALAQLDRVLGFVPKAEGKVTSIFPVAIAMLGVIAIKVPIKEPISWRALWAGLAAAALGMCLFRVYETLFPRLQAPRPSLTFFGSISKRTESEYLTQVLAATDQEVVEDAASQIWRNSQIVAGKFGTAKQAFHWIAAALPPWLIFLALVTLKDGKSPFGGLS